MSVLYYVLNLRVIDVYVAQGGSESVHSSVFMLSLQKLFTLLTILLVISIENYTLKTLDLCTTYDQAVTLNKMWLQLSDVLLTLKGKAGPFLKPVTADTRPIFMLVSV
jgi:hypothetical protein